MGTRHLMACLFGLTTHLQSVLNASVRIIFRLRCQDHISQALFADLHWPERIDLKLAVTLFVWHCTKLPVMWHSTLLTSHLANAFNHYYLELYKIINNIYDSETTIEITCSPYTCTRGNSFKLFSQHCGLESFLPNVLILFVLSLGLVIPWC